MYPPCCQPLSKFIFVDIMITCAEMADIIVGVCTEALRVRGTVELFYGKEGDDFVHVH